MRHDGLPCLVWRAMAFRHAMKWTRQGRQRGRHGHGKEAYAMDTEGRARKRRRNRDRINFFAATVV